MFTLSSLKTCCVEVVGCVTSEELTLWEDIPQGV
ncbi:hypothetical protein LXL04_038512, partial [Taraxacum kok-saghyz]